VKLNSADFQRGGFSEDESRDVVAALAGEGLDMIEISGGNYESPAMSGSAASSTRDREAYFLDYARTVRQLAGDVPLAVTGGFRSRGAIREALRAGDCDVVGLARPTVTTSDAAAAILSDRMEVLPTRELRYGMRRVLGRFIDVKALDGVLNISWSIGRRIAKWMQAMRMGSRSIVNEFDCSRGELVMVLEDRAVTGVGVDD
jgi:hypothetical protein